MLNHGKKNNAGCKPHDVVLMFKIILLKRLHNLSDEQAEYQITDRQSFREFLGLASGDAVPDSRTLWLFQDTLIKKGLDARLFARFHAHLDEAGLFVNRGKIIDATFVEVPRQRNKRGENEAIKAGNGQGLWDGQPRKKCQKDIDARWARKDDENHYGYKNHVKLDAESKLIDTYTVTSAEVHDSRAVEPLLSERDRSKSKIRWRIEHAFGFVSNSLGGFTLRSIGLFRARGVIGLINLAYNLCRYEQILRLHLLPAMR
jgi:IS5 family transposase